MTRRPGCSLSERQESVSSEAEELPTGRGRRSDGGDDTAAAATASSGGGGGGGGA